MALPDSTQAPPKLPAHQPFVPADLKMTEFTWKAVLLGLVMTLVLGAANAYLGLRAGITVAATYPAAVIAMSAVRLWKGSILEENLARTAGSIGESVAAGAIFTIPAFVLTQTWASFHPGEAYWKSTALMLVGSVLGVLFVSLVRRVIVEDPELPFPESVAAAEIHKAGQRGAGAAKFLFAAMGIGALVQLLSALRLFATDKQFLVNLGGGGTLRLGAPGSPTVVQTGAVSMADGPSISPAYFGVGYVIGPQLAALNFSGGVLAWGLMVPLLMFFLGPQLKAYLPASAQESDWVPLAGSVWRFIVRPIAVGGMLVGASYTLYRMRKNLALGLSKAIGELRTGQPPADSIKRTERYMSSKAVFGFLALTFIPMLALYISFSGNVMIGAVLAVAMLVIGFFFSTVSGALVGMIGSSNNPISGLTLATLLIAALLVLAFGIGGAGATAVVLGVAAVVCVAAAVAGELYQDFKVGYILGGTPRTIQIVELVAVVVSSLLMYFPLYVLHQGDINAGGIGFTGPALPAPQAGLMAALTQGIVGGDMPWSLVLLGIFMGIAMIMLKVRSPMLVAVGMYLPLHTTFAIFVGGIFRWIADTIAERRSLNEAQRGRVENNGILMASGMIAGEALIGLGVASLNFVNLSLPAIFPQPSYVIGLAVAAFLGFLLIQIPLRNAGRPEDPPAPRAIA